MALILSETLVDGRVLTYHRVAELRVTATAPIVAFWLESFEDAAARADPTISPYRREYEFPFAGTYDLQTEAYRALLASPEWEDALADDGDPNAAPGPIEARPAGTSVWDPDAGAWAAEDVDSVADEVWGLLRVFFVQACGTDIWWDGRLWAADSQTQLRLAQACGAVRGLPDPSTYSRTWFGEDWSGPFILTGTELLEMQAAIEARQAEAEAHLGTKKQEVIDAMAITPAEAAIAAIKAVQWEFDATGWGAPIP